MGGLKSSNTTQYPAKARCLYTCLYMYMYMYVHVGIKVSFFFELSRVLLYCVMLYCFVVVSQLYMYMYISIILYVIHHV